MKRRFAAAAEGGYPYFVAADGAGRVLGYA
jgi:L-amino acid N-acyltransferase YncA